MASVAGQSPATARASREAGARRRLCCNGAIAPDHAQGVDGTVDLPAAASSAKLARSDAPVNTNYDPVLEQRYDEAAISLVDARRIASPRCMLQRTGRGASWISRGRTRRQHEDAEVGVAAAGTR